MPNTPQDDLFNIDRSLREERYAADLQAYSVLVNKQEELLIAKEERVKKLIEQYMSERNRSEKKARELALQEELKRQESVYKKTSLNNRDIYLKRRSYEIELLKQRLDNEERESLAHVRGAKKRQKIQEEFENKRRSYTEKQLKYEEELLKTQEAIYRVTQKYSDVSEQRKNAKERLDASKEELKNLIIQHDLLKEQYKDDLKNKDFIREEASLAERIQAIGRKRLQDKKEYYSLTQKDFDMSMQRIKAEREDDEEIQRMLGKRKGISGLKESSRSEVEMYSKILGEAITHYQETKRAVKRGDASADDLVAAESSLAKAKADYDKAESTDRIVKSVDSMASQVVTNLIKINESINSEVEKAIYSIKEYQPHVMARLQGTSKQYANILDALKKTLGVSPFVSLQETLDNAVKLIDMGIAYNIEERAFLQSISEDIATTFDAFDSNLLRLIRLQQADTTAARMGMEAYLTQFLNKMFSDTSYLSNVYDAVSAALVDAQSMMPYYEATSSEYILQKWFGSLYALGFSDTAVQRIAKGLNMLLTGDVQGLASDTAMQTLLAMSASRIDTVDYAEAMLKGLDSSQINDLMLSMVTYLQEIAKNSDTRVVRSAFGDVFDMSMSDLAAIQNLTSADLSSIYANQLSYENAYKEAGKQLLKVPERLALSDMINNVLSNVLFSAGIDIANNAVAYFIYTLADALEDATGGINLPNIEFEGGFATINFGGNIDLSMFTVEGLLKQGIASLFLIGQIPTIFESISRGAGLSSDIFGVWGANQLTSRGVNTLLNVSGVSSGISSSSSSNGALSAEGKKALGALGEVLGIDDASPTTISDVYNLLNERFEIEKTISDTTTEIYDTLTSIGNGLNEKIGTLPTFASGTRNAPSGLAIVGENGPELVRLSGGESIFNSTETSNLISSLSTTSSTEAYILNNVKISDIDANFENKLKQILKQVLSDKSSGIGTAFDSADEEDNFKELVKKMLDGEINVNVKNSNFDEFLQKNTYNF